MKTTSRLEVGVVLIILTSLAVLVVRSFTQPQPIVINVEWHPQSKEQPTQTDDGGDGLTPVDLKQINCLAQNIYFESRGEEDQGKLAVALVTFNRLTAGYAKDICGVVFQKRGGSYQFSWVLKVTDKTIKEPKAFDHCLAIARDTYVKKMIERQAVPDITNGANFYRASWLRKAPKWERKVKHTVSIGTHIFYR
jgi:spore germination cell wall hydrolase CwlJ-like protein